MHLLSSELGWAAAADGTLVKVVDGGRLCQAWQSPAQGHLWSLDFSTDQQLGIAVGDGGSVLLTKNRGDAWQTQNTGFSSHFYAVCVQTHQSIWIAGEQGQLLFSNNEGHSWQPQLSPTDASVLDIVIDSVNERLWLCDAQGCLHHKALTSTSWQTLELTPTVPLHRIALSGDGNMVAVGARGHCYVSHNAGQSWEEAQLPTTEGLWDAVYLAGSTSVLVCGDAGSLLLSEDLGVHWTQLDLDESGHLAAIGYSDQPDRIVLGGNGSVLIEIDLSTNEVVKHLSSDGKNMQRITFDDDGVLGFVVGDGGRVYTTLDQGWHWQSIAPPWPNNLYDIAHGAAGQQLIAVARGGRIIRSLDGGTHWHCPDSGTSCDLLAVTFDAQMQRGIIVGDHGTIVTSSESLKEGAPTEEMFNRQSHPL